MWQRAPYIKSRGFLPNPIPTNGIPKYADSIRNKKVIGTHDWQRWWEEQIYYIHNGITTGGIYISGFLYYFLNFRKIPTRFGPMYPWYSDLHREIFHFIEYVKSVQKNGLFPKGRRIGASEFFAAYLDYHYRFSANSYNAGVAAGNDDYIQDFMSKWRYADSLMLPELRIGKLTNNDKEIVAGYEMREDGIFVQSGSRNTIYTRTAGNNPNLFKGLRLNDVFIEELGEFLNVMDFISATEECLTTGADKFGTFWAFGTGGRQTEAFRELHYKGQDHNFITFFIKGTRFYFPYFGRFADDKKPPVIPNLIKDLKLYQTVGMDDEIAAEEFIKIELERLAKAGNQQKYLEYKQNRPLTIQDVLTSTVVNNFDVEKLNFQADAIAALDHPKYTKYKMDWKRDENGIPKQPREVDITPLKITDDVKMCIYILDEFVPFLSKLKQYYNVLIAGLDGYDQDTSKTSKSLGAMSIRARQNNFMDGISKMPVAVIRTRPPRKEMFYELCGMAAVLFDLKGNVLCDVRTPGVIQFFKDWGLEKYLAMRPAKFESPNSEQGHDYGVSLNTYSKPLMFGLMQTNIYDNYNKIWFNSNDEHGPNMIMEYQTYDMGAKDSDNDLADADGIALMQDVSAGTPPQDKSKVIDDRRFDLIDYGYDANGELVPVDMGGNPYLGDENSPMKKRKKVRTEDGWEYQDYD